MSDEESSDNMEQPIRSGSKKFKRLNKNRPSEISSKRPKNNPVQTASLTNTRDPRFDDLSGKFSEHHFQNSYGFISEIEKREKEKIAKTIKKEKNSDKRLKLLKLKDRYEQKEKVKIMNDNKKEQLKKIKKKELEQVAEGKKPYFLKKSDRKLLELAEKYKDLQKDNKLESYMMKKRKKNSQKERKKVFKNY
ncbi:unnamed protein product [Dimorphilus gyrociliatus]|uniref:rRNA biogenesis protein RRP36 n=1 Tax=Dimorphilus gyrociliatus TaxID=2664684 RepID=A0A7I8VNR8_9ANNE|nr:unnamed protein product [Dimorphilus gyrociliatus]